MQVYVISSQNQGIKKTPAYFCLDCSAELHGWQKVNMKLIWALIFLMQTHGVKVLTELCTKFNKTSL